MATAAGGVPAPFIMKASDETGRGLTPTTKAFHNPSFLGSKEARLIRVLCEFQEPGDRLSRRGVQGTILFFGSARSMRTEDWERTMGNLRASLGETTDASDKEKIQDKIARLDKVQWMCQWTEVAESLARRLTEWSMTDPKLKSFFSAQPDYLTGQTTESGQPLVVTTGGGPGIMEAANKGAASVPGAVTMGMGISLPFEKGLNPHVTKDLAFEFHYFFTRKFWMMYSAKALVVGPGGFGTFDELFELLTLRQTGKLPDLPIVLLGSSFWKTCINWQSLADFGVVSQSEIDKLVFADDVETAFQHIVTTISETTLSSIGSTSPSWSTSRAGHAATAVVSPALSHRPLPPAGSEVSPLKI